MVTAVVLVSVVLQVTAAALALRLIRVTGGLKAWMLIGSALGLMAVRRVIPLIEALAGKTFTFGTLPFEVVGVLISALMVAGVASITPLFESIQRSRAEREKLIAELQEALAHVKTLTGLLPICASCKKIRDDKGSWNVLEGYIQDHSNAEFSHGLCPECAKALYPDHYNR